MANMTSQEMIRVAFLLDNLEGFNAIEGVHIGNIPLFDDNGEPLGELDLNNNIFIPEKGEK